MLKGFDGIFNLKLTDIPEVITHWVNFKFSIAKLSGVLIFYARKGYALSRDPKG
ncbi:hypothetical protein D3C71_2225880 [compost metagenome]